MTGFTSYDTFVPDNSNLTMEAVYNTSLIPYPGSIKHQVISDRVNTRSLGLMHIVCRDVGGGAVVRGVR